LLALLPDTQEHQQALLTLGDSLCYRESIRDMRDLARVAERLPAEFAKAVLLAPDLLPAYVSYASTAVLDPHNDYAVQMKAVCQKLHERFNASVQQMPENTRRPFVQHIMNPDTCTVLAIPESDR
jgi:hypothetical protein